MVISSFKSSPLPEGLGCSGDKHSAPLGMSQHNAGDTETN